MAKSDNEQAERVRSARAWLERAEKSFDNKADVRGELNLMLAEAEMKNLRKNHGTGRKILKKKASANGEIKKKAALYLENTSIFSYFLRFIPYLLLLVVVNKTAQHPPHAADAPFLQPVHIRQADR